MSSDNEYKDIIDIQDKLKSLENIEIKLPDNLVDNTTLRCVNFDSDLIGLNERNLRAREQPREDNSYDSEYEC